MIEKLMHKYALSKQGASDMIKAIISATISNIILMVPVALLYYLVRDYMAGNLGDKVLFYVAGCLITFVLIGISTYIQYNATFLSTYVESGVRRVTLAEKLRKIPLSFFGKKDLSDLTSTIMNDCAQMETASSHFIPELFGACISTALIAIGLFFFDWRMAIAALWVLPVSFLIVGCSGKVQKSLNKKQMVLKMACADGIQECLENVRDLQAYNTQEDYMKGLTAKIKAVEKHAIVTELGTAVFVGSSQMILKLGIATVALVGGVLLAKGELDILTFFMFLMVVSRIYDPMQVSLQNLAAVIASGVQSDRLDEILSHEVQDGTNTMKNDGYDIEFSNVGFSYETGDVVLKDVSFTAKQGEVTALIGPSGGGKTTVSRLASRFWDANRGSITVGGMDISKDGRWMLYGTDTTGDERYDFRIRDLETGDELEERFEGIGGACFTPDAQWVFYVLLDAAWRPYAVMRHRVGTPVPDDVEVYREADERFWVGIGLSFDERNIVIGTGSKTTSELLMLPVDTPEGSFRAFIPRETDVEYDVSFACFEGAGEHGEDIPLAVVYHNALNPNFEIDVIDMRTHEPPYRLGEGVRVAVGSPYGCEHGDDVDPGASSMPIGTP